MAEDGSDGSSTAVSDMQDVAVLGAVDYVVVALMLLLSSGIGLYYRCTGGHQATLKEYMLADRNMSFVPVAFSLMASFMSAITLLGVVQEMYMFGTQFIMINVAYIIATPIVCYFYLPVFFRLQKTSVYEYLELRFGYPTRLLASLAFSLQMTLYMGIVLYAPALALAAVTGLSQTLSIVSVGVVCTFYSSLGGMKAVLLTDVLQSLLMFAAVFIVLVTGLQRYSVGEVFRIAGDSGRLEFFIVDPDPRTRHTLWTQIIGGVFTYLSLYGVNQAQVQRLLTIGSLRRSQSAVWLQWPILMTLSFTTAFAGLIIYAHYKDCDPLLTGVITNSDQLLPLYVVQFAGQFPGVTGLFVAGVFSGSLSTVSSSLNSLSAVTIADYIVPALQHLRPGLSTATPRLLPSLLSVMYGVVCVGVAFLTATLGSGVLQASLTVFGAVGGPLLGLFTLGMTARRATQRGAIAGLLLSLAFSLWIGFGQPKPAPVYKPRSTDGCVASNVTYASTSWTEVPAAEAWLRTFVIPGTNLDAGGGGGGYADVTEVTVSGDRYQSGVTVGGDRYQSGVTVGGDSYQTFERSTVDGNAGTRTTDGGGGEGDEGIEFNFLHELYAVSYAWVATIGFLVTYIAGLLVSLTSRECAVDKRLMATCYCGGGLGWGDDEEREEESENGEETRVIKEEKAVRGSDVQLVNGTTNIFTSDTITASTKL